MRISRTKFYNLIRQAVIYSDPVGDFPGLNTFAVTHDIESLAGDEFDRTYDKDSPLFYSNAAQGSVRLSGSVKANFYQYPLVCIFPISESFEELGGASVSRRTLFQMYILSNYVHQTRSERQFTKYEIQDFCSQHARRIFQAMGRAVYATPDGGDPDFWLKEVLDARVAVGAIAGYSIDQRLTNRLRKDLFADSVAAGGYVDKYTSHDLYGVVYNWAVVDCNDDSPVFTNNELCC